jgi:hypothetical protein
VSMSAHDRHELGAIEEELAASDPKLVAMLSAFSRLAAGEAMPGRERIQASHYPSVTQAAFGLVPGRPRRPRRRASARVRQHRVARTVVMVWLAVSFALIAIAVAVSQHGPRASCTPSPTAGCGSNAPARPGILP